MKKKNTLSKSQLKEAIKSIVRESLAERTEGFPSDKGSAEDFGPEAGADAGAPVGGEEPREHGYSEQDELKLIKVLGHVAEILLDMHKSEIPAPEPSPDFGGEEPETEEPEAPAAEEPETDGGEEESPETDEEKPEKKDDEDTVDESVSAYNKGPKNRGAQYKTVAKKLYDTAEDDKVRNIATDPQVTMENEDPEVETGEEHGEEATYFGGQEEPAAEEPSPEPMDAPQGEEAEEGEEVKLLKAVVLISKKLQKLHGGMNEGKDWIQKAVNPKHKRYCTPMTKSTCTPRRKALAKRFKSGDIHHDNVD